MPDVHPLRDRLPALPCPPVSALCRSAVAAVCPSVELHDPADVRALVTPDAAYSCEPYSRPWRGQDESVRQWLERKDKPGQAPFQLAPARRDPRGHHHPGETTSPSVGHTYSNLWVIRLDTEGRCTEFTEWWMRHPQPDEPTVEPTIQP